MSIGNWITEILASSRWFNPHIQHGYYTGPRRSHFWLDLGWAYKDLREFNAKNLRDPARATAKDVFSYLYSLQYYRILRVATYGRFHDVGTVGDQLRRACAQVKSEIGEPQYIHQDRKFETQCKALLESATGVAADEVMKKFAKGLNDDLKMARWETHG